MSSYSDAYADANQSNARPLSSSTSNFVGKTDEKSLLTKEIRVFAIF